MIPTLAWLFLGLGFALATIGTIVPGVPGAVFVVVGILLHKFLLPNVFSWVSISLIAGLALISWIVDFFSGVLGAKLGGATRNGVIGATIGGLVGIVFGIPGMLLGPFCGAIVGDLIAKRRDLALLLKSGSGALFGFVISMFTRLIILIIMLVIVLFSAF